MADSVTDVSASSKLHTIATVAAPTVTKVKQPPRNKGKTWKPLLFDHSVDQNVHEHNPEFHDYEAPFNVPSRDSSSSRSSMRGKQPYPTALDRQDTDQHVPNMAKDEFQLITGRNRKPGTGKTIQGLGAYEDDPEETAKPATVAATYNKRHIHDVFGNELPGPDFIQQNTGFKDRQVYFVQHPNGDVSAHQWSESAFVWTNIGQYSNIRKRIEGQLGSDRLRGETEVQTLQQNTLHYFRAIAKQREGAVPPATTVKSETILDYVQEEPSGVPVSSSVLPKANSKPASSRPVWHAGSVPFEPSAKMGYVREELSGVPVSSSVLPKANSKPASSRPVWHAGSVPFEPLAKKLERTSAQQWDQLAPPTSKSTVTRMDDPFSSRSFVTKETISQSGISTDGQGGIDYNFHFPTGLSSFQSTPLSLRGAGRTHPISNSFDTGVRMANNTALKAGFERSSNSVWSHQEKEVTMDGAGDQGLLEPSTFQHDTGLPQRRGVTPYYNPTHALISSTSNRDAMKVHLHKLGDSAIARNPARTVLHDPFQTQRASDHRESAFHSSFHRTGVHATIAADPMLPGSVLDTMHRERFQEDNWGSDQTAFTELRNSDPEPGWKERPVQ
ncbi:hypothetical protein LTR66_012855, partial [Elasticomyces elasticus]